MDIKTLQNKIELLQKELNNLKSSSAFPRDIENALRERLGSVNITSSTNMTITYNGKVLNIAYT